MSRYIFPLLTFVALALPAQAQCGSADCSCACSSAFSVYPEVTESRRLPGQWWDDRTAYPVAPPANHAYGFVDNSHKPWSLIPGEGYVGASPDKAPEDEETEEAEGEAKPSAPVEPTPDPLSGSEKEEGLGFSSKKDDDAKPAAADEAMKDDEEKEAAPKSKDEPSEMKRDDRERRDMPRRRRRPFRRPEENEEQGAVSAPSQDASAALPTEAADDTKDSDLASPSPENRVSTPDDDQAEIVPADKAGLTLSLFSAAFLALMFSGHFARKACQAPRNEGPATRI